MFRYISKTDCYVLQALSLRPRISQSLLAQLADTSPKTVYRSLNRLETLQLIKRTDRRRGRPPLIQLTDQARSYL